MNYSTYKEEYLDRQVELVNSVTKGWDFGYPDAEQLKEVYSRENFTPETRHYYFEGDDLVGFVASAVENKEGDIQYGSIQMPFVNLADEVMKKDLEKKLLERAKATLKEKGVNLIRSNFNEKWPVDYIKSFYTEKETLQRTAEILNYKEIGLGPSSGNVVDMNMETHLDIFHKGLINQFPEMTLEQMIGILKQASESQGFVKRLLAIENDMVVAQGRAGIFEDQGFILIFAYHVDGIKYKAEIIRSLLNEIKDRELKIVRLTHTYQDAAPEDGYDDFNLDFVATKRYEMMLFQSVGIIIWR